jgi:hypothetical protein
MVTEDEKNAARRLTRQSLAAVVAGKDFTPAASAGDI